jgi:general stress protein 26
MEISDAQTFLRDNQHGVLVARKKDGSLQMILVSPVIDAEGKVIITARDSTDKVKNMKRDPRISLLVYGDKFNGSNYIQVDGRAEIIEHPRAMDIVLD